VKFGVAVMSQFQLLSAIILRSIEKFISVKSVMYCNL